VNEFVSVSVGRAGVEDEDVITPESSVELVKNVEMPVDRGIETPVVSGIKPVERGTKSLEVPVSSL
jgi:hypothetical protein